MIYLEKLQDSLHYIRLWLTTDARLSYFENTTLLTLVISCAFVAFIHHTLKAAP